MSQNIMPVDTKGLLYRLANEIYEVQIQQLLEACVLKCFLSALMLSFII